MKKLLSLVLVCAMLVSMTGAFAAEYRDTGDHWAETAIDRWTEAGVVSGAGGAFRPEGEMSRAEAAQVFANLLRLDEKADLSGYSDVNADAWYADAMASCVAKGILKGNGGNQMLPTASVSRETFFVMVARALGVPEETTANQSFGDSAQVSDWAGGFVNGLINRGFVKGAGGLLAPTVDINRASVMALLDQTICAYVTEAGAVVTPTGEGVALILANDVTVNGDFAGSVVIATDGVEVSLEGLTGEANVIVNATDVVLADVPEGVQVETAETAEGVTVNGAEVEAGSKVVATEGGVEAVDPNQPDDPNKPDDEKPKDEEHIHNYSFPSYSVDETGALQVTYTCSCSQTNQPTDVPEALGLSAESNGIKVQGRFFENGYATFVLPIGEVHASGVTATVSLGAYQWVIDVSTELTQTPQIENWLDNVCDFQAATMTVTAGTASAVYSFYDAETHVDAENNPVAYTVMASVDDVQPIVDVLTAPENVEITDVAAGSQFFIANGSTLQMGKEVLEFVDDSTTLTLTSDKFANQAALSAFADEVRAATKLTAVSEETDIVAHLAAGTILTIDTKQIKLLKDLTVTMEMNGSLNGTLTNLKNAEGAYGVAYAIVTMVNDIVGCLDSSTNATCDIVFE